VQIRHVLFKKNAKNVPLTLKNDVIEPNDATFDVWFATHFNHAYDNLIL